MLSGFPNCTKTSGANNAFSSGWTSVWFDERVAYSTLLSIYGSEFAYNNLSNRTGQQVRGPYCESYPKARNVSSVATKESEDDLQGKIH